MTTSGGLSPAKLLDVVDAGSGSDPAERGLLLLAAARPDLDQESLPWVGLDERDAAIVALRCATFGDSLSGRITCPACHIVLAVSMTREELAREPGGGPVARIELGEFAVEARPPCGSDLLHAAAEANVADARLALIDRCVVEARAGSVEIDPADLPDEVLDGVGEAILAAAPGAELRVELTCAQCGHAWAPVLDPVLFMWQELSGASAQMLDDVHQLAAAYGWTEADVLSLSARRRRRYVERLLDA